MRTRAEHLQWSKDRALEYANRNDFDQAMTSMCSDLRKHEETADHIGAELWMSLRMAGSLTTRTEVIDFINGFN